MNSNRWKTLYNEQPEGYEWMVQHEDYEHNLLPDFILANLCQVGEIPVARAHIR